MRRQMLRDLREACFTLPVIGLLIGFITDFPVQWALEMLDIPHAWLTTWVLGLLWFFLFWRASYIEKQLKVVQQESSW